MTADALATMRDERREDLEGQQVGDGEERGTEVGDASEDVSPRRAQSGAARYRCSSDGAMLARSDAETPKTMSASATVAAMIPAPSAAGTRSGPHSKRRDAGSESKRDDEDEEDEDRHRL